MSCSEFSLKESSGLLSIVQLSKFFVLSFATALIDYHIFRRLSTTFLFFCFSGVYSLETAYLEYHVHRHLSTTFFISYIPDFRLCLMDSGASQPCLTRQLV